MIPPESPFVKHFLTKTDILFWWFCIETGVRFLRTPSPVICLRQRSPSPVGEGFERVIDIPLLLFYNKQKRSFLEEGP